MNKKSKTTVDSVAGEFFGISAIIENKKLIKIYNKKNIPFLTFKKSCDLLAVYLINEGFIKTKTPFIEML